ncbi:MAG: tryptophan-rich sensory protein [Planctomycetes bacterium]|nr:tryptophan-rich sensory protein [Planctomycetota bacterium]
MNTWHTELERPPLTPPGWIFGPVWTILYAMIAVSIFLYVRETWADRPYAVYGLILVHLTANFSWTSIFFGLQSPGWALVDIALIDITLAAMIFVFWNSHRLASVLLWPYLGWVLFATYLNAGLYLLNNS